MQKIINRIANKEKLITNLLGHFFNSEQRCDGLERASESILVNQSEANARKMISTTMKVLRDQMKMNQDILALLVMVASDDSFTSMQAKFAMKTGANPEDVLKQMLRDKMGGR